MFCAQRAQRANRTKDIMRFIFYFCSNGPCDNDWERNRKKKKKKKKLILQKLELKWVRDINSECIDFITLSNACQIFLKQKCRHPNQIPCQLFALSSLLLVCFCFGPIFQPCMHICPAITLRRIDFWHYNLEFCFFTWFCMKLFLVVARLVDAMLSTNAAIGASNV